MIRQPNKMLSAKFEIRDLHEIATYLKNPFVGGCGHLVLAWLTKILMFKKNPS